jgi:hypothetical protein
MKLGFAMYWRAVTQLLSNLLAVIWATGPAWVLLSIATGAAAFFIVGDATGPDTSQKSGNALKLPAFFWTYFLISQSLNLLTLGYIGPRFHRITLPENTADLPIPYLSYVFALIKLGLIAIGLAFLASRVISVIAPTIPGPLGEFTIPIMFLIIVLYVLLRFSLILPAIAMSRPKDMQEAWKATVPFRYSAISSLILLVLTFAALHSLPLVSNLDPWLKLFAGALTSWFALMVLLSYFNVIYREARKIEHRMARER